MKDYVRWSLALLVAGLASIWTIHGWQRMGRALGLMVGLFHPKQYVPKKVSDARLRICERCPIYFRPMGTCGSPLSWSRRGTGCWCYMPIKAKLPDAECWLDAEDVKGFDYGWKANDQ